MIDKMSVIEKARIILELERDGVSRRQITSAMRDNSLSFDGALKHWQMIVQNRKATKIPFKGMFSLN